jgi:hypothetical protein
MAAGEEIVEGWIAEGEIVEGEQRRGEIVEEAMVEVEVWTATRGVTYIRDSGAALPDVADHLLLACGKDRRHLQSCI